MSTVSRRRATKPLAIATGALVLLFAALPTTTLLAVGMAPTLGAFIGDTTPGRYLTPEYLAARLGRGDVDDHLLIGFTDEQPLDLVNGHRRKSQVGKEDDDPAEPADIRFYDIVNE